MHASDPFTLLALVVFLAASVVGFTHKSWVPALFCLGVFFVVLSGTDFIET